MDIIKGRNLILSYKILGYIKLDRLQNHEIEPNPFHHLFT